MQDCTATAITNLYGGAEQLEQLGKGAVVHIVRGKGSTDQSCFTSAVQTEDASPFVDQRTHE